MHIFSVTRVLSVSFGYPCAAQPARMLFTHEQAQAFRRCGAEVDVLDLSPPEGSPPRLEEVLDGIPVYRCQLPRSFRAEPRAAARRLRETFRWVRAHVSQTQPDLVLMSFVEHKYAPLWTALAAAGSRMALTAHGVDVMARHQALHLRAIKMALLRAAHHVFAVSDATAELTRDLLPKRAWSKVLVVENGVNRLKLDRVAVRPRSELRLQLGWPVDRPVILSVGHLIPRKGLDILIAADALLKQRGRAFVHVIVGRGPERGRLEAMARSLGLAEQVRFVDVVLDDETLSGAFAACDVFALASRTLYRPPAMEGFGIVYAEASYLGRPVVAGKSGGVSTVVRHGRTGFLVDPEGLGAPARFAEAIETILADPAVAARLGANGRAHAQARFDWDLNARRVLETVSAG